MGTMRTMEQERAKVAWERVSQVKGKNWSKEYGQLARSAAADIQANGLGQTLAFWRAKKKDEHLTIFKDVSDWVRGQISYPGNQDLLAWVVEKASTDEYRRATAEAIAFLTWLKRFAEAELIEEGGG